MGERVGGQRPGWSVAGHTAEELIGVGATAEVWRGRELASGRPVALKRLASVVPVDRVKAEISVWASLRGPGVLPVLDVVTDGPVTVLISPLATSLAGLLADRGCLSPPETATMLHGIAVALARAHDRMLVHGDVSPGNVLFDDAGRPLLADFGQSSWAAAAAPASAATLSCADPRLLDGLPADPAADVFALCAVAYAAVGGRPLWLGAVADAVAAAARVGLRPAVARLVPTASAELIAAVEAGLDRDPGARPSAAELAESVSRRCPTRPIAVTTGRGGPTTARTDRVPLPVPQATAAALPSEVRAGRRLRAVVITIGGVLAVSGAVTAGLVWGRHGGEPVAALTPLAETSSASPSPVMPVDWRPVVQRLADARTRAVAQRRPGLLSVVYIPGSAPAKDDRRTVRELARRDLSERDLHTVVTAVRPVSTRTGRVVLDVVETTSAWRIIDPATRQTVSMATGPSRAELTMELVSTGSGWRIATLRQIS